MQIASGDQASLAISPREWVQCWEEQPRLMAILGVVQNRVRSRMADEARSESEKLKAKAAKGRHART